MKQLDRRDHQGSVKSLGGCSIAASDHNDRAVKPEALTGRPNEAQEAVTIEVNPPRRRPTLASARGKNIRLAPLAPLEARILEHPNATVSAREYSSGLGGAIGHLA